MLTRKKALVLNKKGNTTGYTDQVNCVASLIYLTSLEEKEDKNQYNTLYVGGPWVQYKKHKKLVKVLPLQLLN